MLLKVVWSVYILFAHLATATVHLWWNDLAWTAIRVASLCLANPGVGILEGIIRLHMLVLFSFAIILSFRITSASELPFLLQFSNISLNFDDLSTKGGWADLPANYSFLDFTDFHVLKPSDPAFTGLISEYDLNCAVSPPNAVYGARPIPFDRLPKIQLYDVSKDSTGPTSFTLHSLQVKPLDMPLGHVRLNLKGLQLSNETLKWDVDFPAGFHDVLDVRIAEFSRISWVELQKLEIWADFYHSGTTMDWEFCLDDLQVSFQY